MERLAISEPTFQAPHLLPLSPQTEIAQKESTLQTPRIETKLIGKKLDRDVRVAVAVAPDGTTVFDRQPEPDAILDSMFQKADPGHHKFTNYEYQAKVLWSRPLDRKEDAVGNTQMIFEAILLGDHYKNGLGEKISREKSWSVRIENGQIVKEEETRAFIAVSYTPYNPGRTYARVMRWNNMNPDYSQAKKIYKKVMSDEVAQARMGKLQQQREAFRQQKHIETAKTAETLAA